MNCSVVVPVYRGEETLVPLVERLVRVLPSMSDAYEVILVNDGSPDGSWGVIEGLSRKYPWLRGINLMRNYGQENALLCGIREARVTSQSGPSGRAVFARPPAAPARR